MRSIGWGGQYFEIQRRCSLSSSIGASWDHVSTNQRVGCTAEQSKIRCMNSHTDNMASVVALCTCFPPFTDCVGFHHLCRTFFSFPFFSSSFHILQEIHQNRTINQLSRWRMMETVEEVTTIRIPKKGEEGVGGDVREGKTRHLC